MPGCERRVSRRGVGIRRFMTRGCRNFFKLCSKMPLPAMVRFTRNYKTLPTATLGDLSKFSEILAAIGGSTTRASEQAIALRNGIKQGTGSHRFLLLHRAKPSILKVNCATAGAAVNLPIGRWKLSGTRPPEHGLANREFLRRMQAIYLRKHEPHEASGIPLARG